MNKIYEPFLWLFIDICPLFRHTIHHCSGVSSRLSVCVACYANGARVSRARARSAGARVRTEAAANTGAGAGPGRPELGNTFEYSGEHADRGDRRWNGEMSFLKDNSIACFVATR